MEDFYVYDGFALAGIMREYSYIKWVRRYSEPGAVTIETLATDDMRWLIRAGRILTKGGDGEAAIIEDFTSSRDAQGREIITANGRFLSSILDRRVFDYAATAKLSAVINAILDQNFLSPTNANRKIPEMRRLSYTLANDPQITVKYDHANALDEISRLCQLYNIGLKAVFNTDNKSLDFSLYEGKQTSAVFSDGFFNVLEQDYYEQTSKEKTTCIVGGGGNGMIVGDAAAGLGRKEIYVQSDANGGTAAAQTAGEKAIWDNRKTGSFDTVLNMAALQFPYKTYWDLGDVVTCENLKWGASVTQNVLEVTEYYDKGGVHVTPVFGDLVGKT